MKRATVGNNARESSRELATFEPFLRRWGLAAVTAVELVAVGRGNRVFRVNDATGQYALKVYGRSQGGRTRWLTEQAWYELVRPQAGCHMPEPVAWDECLRAGLFKWVEGTPLTAADLTPEVLAGLLAFMGAVNRARPAAAGRAFPPAAGACFSVYERLDAVGRVVAQTARAMAEGAGVRKMAARLEPAWQVVQAAVLQRAEGAGVDPRRTLPLNSRMLAAPDWGLHQALRTAEGRLVFMDFDGAGWEDPAWWLAGVFARADLAPPLERWVSFVSSAVRLLGVEPETGWRAGWLLPARRFQEVCLILAGGLELKPGAARRQAFKRAEAALEDLSAPRWWHQERPQ